MSHDLIVTARRLAWAGATRPRQADLRRAVSTGYYALFHALARHCADLIIGAGRNRGGGAWIQVYRALEHGFVRNACEQAQNLVHIDRLRAKPLAQLLRHQHLRAWCDLALNLMPKVADERDIHREVGVEPSVFRSPVMERIPYKCLYLRATTERSSYFGEPRVFHRSQEFHLLLFGCPTDGAHLIIPLATAPHDPNGHALFEIGIIVLVT